MPSAGIPTFPLWGVQSSTSAMPDKSPLGMQTGFAHQSHRGFLGKFRGNEGVLESAKPFTLGSHDFEIVTLSKDP